MLVGMIFDKCGKIMWVVINFAWGLIHLIRTRTSVFGGDENWAFGQVVPLILLAAPLITVVEYFNRGIALEVSLRWIVTDHV